MEEQEMNSFPDMQRHEYTVSPMFRVGKPRKVPWSARKSDKSSERVPFLSFRSHLVLILLNPLTLFWIGMAIGVAIFGSAFTRALEIEESVDKALSPITAVMCAQTLSGANATLWNLRTSAEADFNGVVLTYTTVGRIAGTIGEFSSRNATLAMGNWAAQEINATAKVARDALAALNRVEGVLESSGLFANSNMTVSNTSQLQNVTVPLEYRDYGPLRGLNFSSNFTVAPAINDATAKLVLLNPYQNDTSAVTSSYEAMRSSTKGTATALIVVWSVLAVLSMVPVGIIKWIQWRANQRTALSLHLDNVECGRRTAAAQEKAAQIQQPYVARMSRAVHGVKAKWWIAWALSPPMLRLIYVGTFLGLLSICDAGLISATLRHDRGSAQGAMSQINSSVYDILGNAISALVTQRSELVNQLDAHLQDLLAGQGMPKLNVTVGAPSYAKLAIEQAAASDIGSNSIDGKMTSILISVNGSLGAVAATLFGVYTVFAAAGALYSWFSSKKL